MMARPTPKSRPDAGALRSMTAQFAEFVRDESAGALVLLAATFAAVVIANSPLAGGHEALLRATLGVSVAGRSLGMPVLNWVNDALMAVFFFVVGLEIKRELVVGELSSIRSAMLPAIAAAGGMVVPALIFSAFNAGSSGAHGWGVPMATDIAFALGALTLLGNRVPTGLRVFLAALAIADDIGAVLVIALFYTARIEWLWLLVAVAPVVVMFALNRMRVAHPAPYVLASIVLWFAFLSSGVHATVAGVVAALMIPATAAPSDGGSGHTNPLEWLEDALHPLVTFGVLPVFALANAGVAFSGAALASRVSLGVIVGLVGGKALGVAGATLAAVRMGVADLPAGVTSRHVLGAGALAGIGFTMSLFIAHLAFPDAALVEEAKAAILVASAIAGLIGYVLLRFWAPARAGE